MKNKKDTKEPTWHIVHAGNIHSHYCWDRNEVDRLDNLVNGKSYGAGTYAWKFGVIICERVYGSYLEYIKELCCKECGRPLDE